MEQQACPSYRCKWKFLFGGWVVQSKSTLNLVLGLPSAISHLEKIPPQQGTKAPAKQQQEHCNLKKHSEICAITMGRKKTSLKHGYLHGIVTCPYFLGLENGVRFLRRFSFRCSIGGIFVALFVKSSFGTFLLWSCTSQGTRHFQTSIVIDDNTSWSQHWGVHSVALWTQVTSQVWTCVKYVPKQSIP